MTDQNDDIITLIEDRLAVGLDRYKHGIRVHDDTRQWGTPEDGWVEMGLEEVLDLSLYLAAAIIRIRTADLHEHTCTVPVKRVGIIARVLTWLGLRS